MTKSWLKKQGHDFTEYNVSTNPEYANDLIRMGFRVTPVTVIGQDMIVGFSPNKLEKALETV
tara:strand:- start:1972 stop:2157 length:186 start_codon:yes stop_codon:yes gene_type:complete